MQMISEPPEAMLANATSGRRTSEFARGSTASGRQRSRAIHSAWPRAAGLPIPTTRTTPSRRSAAYRRATVCSETSSTSPSRRKETRGAQRRPWMIRWSRASGMRK